MLPTPSLSVGLPLRGREATNACSRLGWGTGDVTRSLGVEGCPFLRLATPGDGGGVTVPNVEFVFDSKSFCFALPLLFGVLPRGELNFKFDGSMGDACSTLPTSSSLSDVDARRSNNDCSSLASSGSWL